MEDYVQVIVRPVFIIFERHCNLACREGTFKSSSGNADCQPCPAMSYSVAGSSSCVCIHGYEPSRLDCTGQ